MIVIGNGRVITWDTENPYIENGAVAVEGTKIVRIGETMALKGKYQTAEFIDAHGKVIMPGYINAHNHIYSAFARGLSIPGNHPKDFLEILEGTWWKIDRKLTLESVYYSALMTYIESVRNGVTTIVDHHASYGDITGSLGRIADAANTVGSRTCLCYEISDRDGKEKCLEAIEESFSFLEGIQPDDGMLQGLVGMHASFTLSDETIAKCRERNRNGWGYHIHAAEGIQDEEYTREHYHMSVIERLMKEGILGTKTLVGHCVHISEHDMDILKQSGSSVVHNPESNMGNAVGAPDVCKMFDKGILVGLGTDGYTNDILESLKVANILTKHRSRNPDRGFLEAAEMCFQNNAILASGIFGRKLGMLREGAGADLIIMDYQPMTPMHAENLYGHVMFGMSGAMTDTTMINGKIIMKDRKLLSVDEQAVESESRIVAGALWKTLGYKVPELR